MATRSYIAKEINDGEFLSIYVHWDGSPDTRLPILEKTYTTEAMVDKLIELGDLSSIDEDFEKNVSYASRGEDWDDVKPCMRTLQELRQHEYAYIFRKDGEWDFYKNNW